MKRKGVSPIIATVLLLGIVVALSTMVFLWARSFVGEVVQKGGKPAEQVCESIVLSAIYSGGSLQILNDGNVPVHKLSILVEQEGNIDSTEYIDPVLAGGSVEVENVASGETIEIVPWILGDGNKVYKCEKTFTANTV